MSLLKITKQEIINLINAGHCLRKTSKGYNPELGTLSDKLSVTAAALKDLMTQYPEIQAAYDFKFHRGNGKKVYNIIELVDESSETTNPISTTEAAVEQPVTVDNFIPDVESFLKK